MARFDFNSRRYEILMSALLVMQLDALKICVAWRF